MGQGHRQRMTVTSYGTNAERPVAPFPRGFRSIRPSVGLAGDMKRIATSARAPLPAAVLGRESYQIWIWSSNS